MVAITLESFLDGTKYSFSWLLAYLEKNDKKFIERRKTSSISKVSCKALGEGNGYMSKVFRVDVYFVGEMKPHTVVLKVLYVDAIKKIQESLLPGDETMEPVESILHMFKTECIFYDRFAKHLSLPLAKVFGSECPVNGDGRGAIIMEYLANEGAIETFKSANVQKIVNVVKCLAKLVAFSLKIGRATVEEYPFPKTNAKAMERVVGVVAEQIIAARPGYLDDCIHRMVSIVQQKSYISYAFLGINEELGIPPVFVHSDLWANNILWKINSDGTTSDEICAIIDWQLLHAGSVAFDLSMFMSLAVDPEIRHEVEKWVFEYFYAVLKAEVADEGLKLPFTVEDIKASYYQALIRHTTFFFFPFLDIVRSRQKLGGDGAEEDCSRLWNRMKTNIEDSIKIFEEKIPQWLQNDFVPKYLQ